MSGFQFKVRALWFLLVSFVVSAHAQPEDKNFAAFSKGVLSFQQKQFDAAAAAFVEIPELGAGYLSLYKHWFLGHAYLEMGKYAEAEPEFAKVLQSASSSEMKYQAQFAMGEAALRQKKYRETELRLAGLERKWKRSYRLPEVLHRLVAANIKLGQLNHACRRALKLYTQYPAHPLVINWGADLSQVEVDGVKLGCGNTRAELAQRIHNLQRAGESEKAHRELTALIDRSPESDRFQLDMTMAAFLLEEGSVEDALNLLIRYYPKQKSDIKYLNLLGKVSGRSGEYQVAVGAYDRIFKLSPKSRQGRDALFKAAYLSYQFQDYDGAVRKFEKLIRNHPTPRILSESRWHLAWLQYLRSDYKGAIARFSQVAKAPGRGGRTGPMQERQMYWSAMSYLRLEKYQEAHGIFSSIVRGSPNSYYGLAAQARLDFVSGKLLSAKTRVPASQKLVPYGDESDKPIVFNGEPAALLETGQGLEDRDSEEVLAESGEDDAATPVPEEGGEEGGAVTEFKDPVLRARLEMAQKLIQLGLIDLARWELLEVERHTRNRQYQRSLMVAYEKIAAYNRAATLAELTFGKEREAGGLEGARGLWLSMYPQAYKTEVEAMAKKYSVSPEWIWAIMRTESMYRTDVISPVGAKGLMQLMPYTARNLFRVAGDAVPEDMNLLDAQVNIRLGSQYLARLGQKFKGSLPLVAAAYNAGPHRVESWLVNFGQLEMDEFVEHVPFLETRNYIKKVMRHHTLYRRLYAKDQKSVELLAKTLGVPIPMRAATRETWESL